MGFFDFVGDVFSFSSVDAEAPGEDSSSKGQETEPRAAVTGGASNKTPASKEQESGEETEVNKADAKTGGGDDEGHKASGGDDEEGGEEEEEEEEDDDEPVDPKPKLEEGKRGCPTFCLLFRNGNGTELIPSQQNA